MLGITPTWRREAGAESCVALFLAAALRSQVAGYETLGAALFAQGAVDAAARHAELDSSALARVERALLRNVGGSRVGAALARRALREFERTQRGRAIRRAGAEALRAWLRGEAPAARAKALLRSAAR